MEAKIRKGNLVIAMPVEDLRPSGSKKTLLVATSRGTRATTVRVDGKIVYVIAHAFVYPDQTPEPKKLARKSKRR